MSHPSSTLQIPDTALVPNHVAIIMDGNGRWATKRYLPRVAGHPKAWKQFVKSLRRASRAVLAISLYLRSARKTGGGRQTKSPC